MSRADQHQRTAGQQPTRQPLWQQNPRSELLGLNRSGSENTVSAPPFGGGTITPASTPPSEQGDGWNRGGGASTDGVIDVLQQKQKHKQQQRQRQRQQQQKQQRRQQQQQQEQPLQQQMEPLFTRRFIVKTHKPEAPDDQKQCIERLQQSVVFKMSQMLNVMINRPQHTGNDGTGETSPNRFEEHSTETSGRANKDERIQAIKLEISEEIQQTFRKVAAAQNDKVLQAEGLLKEAQRKQNILEKVIEEKDREIERRLPPDGVDVPTETQQSRDLGDSADKGQAAAAAAAAAASKGEMIRIRAGGGAGGEGTTDLVALSRSTLESHLRLFLASQQRVGALEEEIAAARREASAGAGAKQALLLHVSEGGTDAIVDKVAGACAQQRFLHGATLTGIPTVAELPAVAPAAGGGDFVRDGRGSAGRAAVGKGGLEIMRAERKQEGWGSGASGIAGELQHPSILHGKMDTGVESSAQQRKSNTRGGGGGGRGGGGVQASQMAAEWGVADPQRVTKQGGGDGARVAPTNIFGSSGSQYQHKNHHSEQQHLYEQVQEYRRPATEKLPTRKNADDDNNHQWNSSRPSGNNNNNNNNNNHNKCNTAFARASISPASKWTVHRFKGEGRGGGKGAGGYGGELAPVAGNASGWGTPDNPPSQGKSPNPPPFSASSWV